MKKAIATFLMAVLALLNAGAAESDLRFELESSVRTIPFGQSSYLKLKIVGSEVHEITEKIEKTEGVSSSYAKKPGVFVYEFSFNPRREGKFIFGPYSLSVNGQKLTSNTVEINVLPKGVVNYGTFFRVDKNTIVLGETIELVMETWSKKQEYNKYISFNRSESFTSNLEGSSTTSFKSGNDQVFYSRHSWRITPKQCGDFQITKDLLRELPADIPPPNFTIKVEEKKETAEQPGSVGRDPAAKS